MYQFTFILDINIVTKAILRLKPDKALGPDELSLKLLIETRNEIAYPLLRTAFQQVTECFICSLIGSKLMSHRFLKTVPEVQWKITDQ